MILTLYYLLITMSPSQVEHNILVNRRLHEWES